MNTSIFTQRPLCLMLGLAMLAGATVSAHAQSFVRTTPKEAMKSALVVSGSTIDARAGNTLVRLTKALPAFWATTEPSKAYMILNTMVRRAADGTVTFNEEAGPYTFGPTVTPAILLQNGPRFVDLLLGHYANMESIGLNELTAALAEYFGSSRPGQAVGITGGQLMRNYDGSAIFTDGAIIFVFDENTSAKTIATMAPALAAALTPYASAIAAGTAVGGYALRDPSNPNQLINHDGRIYDTTGHAVGNASPGVVGSLFGGGNGSNGSGTPSSSGATTNPASNASGGSAGSGSGTGGGNSNPSGGANAGSGSGSSAGSPNSGASGSTPVSGNSPQNNAGSPAGSNAAMDPALGGTPSPSGTNAGGLNGQGLNGTVPLAASSATAITNTMPSGSINPALSNCHVIRYLGSGGGQSSCN